MTYNKHSFWALDGKWAGVWLICMPLSSAWLQAVGWVPVYSTCLLTTLQQPQLLASSRLGYRTFLSCGTSGSQGLRLLAGALWLLPLPIFHHGLSSAFGAGRLLAVCRTEPRPTPSHLASLFLCSPTGCTRSPCREGKTLM